MTTAHPGQEQRMEAIARAICEAKGYDPDAPINETQVQWQAFTELAKSTVTCPTADLGEDGELVALVDDLDASNLRSVAKRERANRNAALAAVIDQAADRLILYREALAAISVDYCRELCGGCEGDGHWPECEHARAVLSRSEEIGDALRSVLPLVR